MSDEWGKKYDKSTKDLIKYLEGVEAEYINERKQYVAAAKEEKLKLMCDKVAYLVALFAYHGAFRGDGTLEAMATYGWYEEYYFSEVENTEENYIDFLRCYVNGYHSAALCCDFETQEEIDVFIKNKCREAGLLNVYRSMSK